MTGLIDTSALFALLDADDLHHQEAVRTWDAAPSVDLVAHGHVVAETLALVRARLGWPAVTALIDRVLPAVRVEMVERVVHGAAIASHRAVGGGTSFVDRVTIAFAQHHGITTCFAYDLDLVAAGLRPLAADERAPDPPVSAPG